MKKTEENGICANLDSYRRLVSTVPEDQTREAPQLKRYIELGCPTCTGIKPECPAYSPLSKQDELKIAEQEIEQQKRRAENGFSPKLSLPRTKILGRTPKFSLENHPRI